MGKGYGSLGANNYSGSRVRFKRTVLNIKSILVWSFNIADRLSRLLI